MSLMRYAMVFFWFIVHMGCLCAQQQLIDPIEQTGFLPAQSVHVNWVFSGVVANEAGEHYAYFFQMQRHEHSFHVVASLFDAQTKTLILQDEGDVVLDNAQAYDWQVGHSFLRFNAINNSWIFGIKTDDKKGFNFKVDMLHPSDHSPVTQDLRAGIEFIASQTGSLNGHIQFGLENNDQFVSAKTSWFRQIWLTQTQLKSHPLTSVLCRFDDGSGFYSMNMLESDTVRGAVAGWYDAMGMPLSMSQFTDVKQDANGVWHIRVSSPKTHLVLSDTIKKNAIVVGFVAEKDKRGFCMLHNDVV